jgi:hypothetical protein
MILLRNDETIISSISVTDIFFDVYLGKWNYRAIPKMKTWSYFLTIPKYFEHTEKCYNVILPEFVKKALGCREIIHL